MPLWRRRRRQDALAGFVKVRFHLEQDDEGYPPQGSELVWAERAEHGLRIANVPWFAPGIAIDDVVEARDVDGMLEFTRVVERSGHSTLRVVLFDAAETPWLRERLQGLGCDTELSHLPRLISVDVPPDVGIAPVLELLWRGEREKRWEFESGWVGDPHVDGFGEP